MTRLPPENTVETCHECGSEVEVGFHCGFVTKCPHCNSRLVACNKCFDLQQEQGIDQICDWNKETNLCFRLRGESPLKIQALKEINVLLPYINKLQGRPVDEFHVIEMPEGVSFIHYTNSIFIEYRHLGLTIRFDDNILQPENEWTVYTADDEGCFVVPVWFVNPQTKKFTYA